MILRRVAVAVVAIALAVPSFAQVTKKKDGKAAQKEQVKPESGAEQQGLSKPSSEMKRFAHAFTGRFRVTAKMDPSDWAPQGDSGVGFEIVRRGPGGFSTISDSRMRFDKSGPLVGHGVIWWNAAKKTFTGIWCDSWAPTCESAGEGRWEGENFVLLGETAGPGGKVPMRQTYSNITADGYDWTMELGDLKGGWKKMMSLKYQRAAGAVEKQDAPKR